MNRTRCDGEGVLSKKEQPKKEFTQEDFDQIVAELLCEHPSFEALARFIEVHFRERIKKICENNSLLKGSDCGDDVVQDLYVRLSKVTVTGFLLRDEIEGEYNNNYVGFYAWVESVAINLIHDYERRVIRRNGRLVDEDVLENLPKPEENEADDEVLDILKKAFETVMACDTGIYKALTWIAFCAFVVTYDITKIESNNKIIEHFEKKTLNEMYRTISIYANYIPWMAMSKEQNEKIQAALQEKRTDNTTYGETTYRDFYMHVKGEPSGKKSISDWENRINSMIKKKIGNDFDF